MIRGIQSAASGMIAQMASEDITANNLANVNTTGYKREVPSFQAILSGQNGAASTSEIQIKNGKDWTAGSLTETGNPLDLALETDGFFCVQTANGVRYTRCGSFTLNSQGQLATQSGDLVLGNSGPIKLSSNNNVQITSDGNISQSGAQVDQLRIVTVANPQQAQKDGSNLWKSSGTQPAPASKIQIRQGYLENSNVNTISEMVTMISALRSYEAGQKVIQAQDETLDKAVNDVGKV